jgi:hypothetical protein
MSANDAPETTATQRIESRENLTGSQSRQPNYKFNCLNFDNSVQIKPETGEKQGF